MRKTLASGAVLLSATLLAHDQRLWAQPPVTAAEPAGASTSATPQETRSVREQSYAKLFEGQRHMWRLQRMQSQAGRGNSRKLAKEAFEAAVALDPTLAEAYAALAQLAVAVQPRDIEEGIRQSELAVKANRDNMSGHRMLGRLFTVKSRLNNGPLDRPFAAKASAAWREVARLDPRNAEAWAFLSAFAEANGNVSEQVEAVKKWVSAAPPADVGFYEGTMGGASLTPEAANLKLASILARTGKPAEAASILSRLISDDPENAEAISVLGEIADSVEGDSAQTIAGALKQAVYANPGNVTLTDTLARLLARLNAFDEAANLLKRNIALLRKDDVRAASTLAVSLAELHLQKDRYDDAAAAYDNALAVRGIASAALVGNEDREFVQYVLEKLIHAAKLANRPQAVRAAIERSRRLFGKDHQFADRQMIAFLEGQGSRQEALALIRSLRAARPSDPGLLRLEASVLTDLGKVDDAVEIVRNKAAVKTPPVSAPDGDDPNTVVVSAPPSDEFSDLLFISSLYTRAARGKDAIEAANRALGIATGSERRQIAKTALATAMQMSGDTAGAEKTLREVLRETPGNPMALNNLGYFLAERGESLEEAVEMIKAALKVDPRNPSYLDSLGWAYFRMGRIAEAERYLMDAARIDADSATIYAHLGDLYNAKNDRARARSLWERALRLATEAAEIERIKKKLAGK